MKNRIFLLVLLLFSTYKGFTQTHQPGVTFLDIAANKSDVGTSFQVGYSKNISEGLFGRLRAYYEMGRLYNVSYSNFGADFMMMGRPFVISDFLQINLGGGVIAGYEKLREAAKENAGKVGFMAGVQGSAEAETFINDQVGVFIQANQAYMLKKSLGKNYFNAGIGLRIFLNNY